MNSSDIKFPMLGNRSIQHWRVKTSKEFGKCRKRLRGSNIVQSAEGLKVQDEVLKQDIFLQSTPRVSLPTRTLTICEIMMIVILTQVSLMLLIVMAR
jgi:hypothetical protein